jgi:hypothetical protein
MESSISRGAKSKVTSAARHRASLVSRRAATKLSPHLLAIDFQCLHLETEGARRNAHLEYHSEALYSGVTDCVGPSISQHRLVHPRVIDSCCSLNKSLADSMIRRYPRWQMKARRNYRARTQVGLSSVWTLCEESYYCRLFVCLPYFVCVTTCLGNRPCERAGEPCGRIHGTKNEVACLECDATPLQTFHVFTTEQRVDNSKESTQLHLDYRWKGLSTLRLYHPRPVEGTLRFLEQT